jgi:hypothetical protein
MRNKKDHPSKVKEPATKPAGGANALNGAPHFAEPVSTPDPTKFLVKHGSDKEAYSILDAEKGKLRPRPFEHVKAEEPVLTLATALGAAGSRVVKSIEGAKQIVFHAAGDTGNVRSPKDADRVPDKLVSDFDESDPRQVPSFMYHLGDVVYSFGEAGYYYDQFYDPYRNYPAPIFAIPGNHDGMVAPNSTAKTLAAFIENFCAPTPQRNAEAGELARTAQIQPAVYFTFEAPFVRILGLYSNCLEDPGVISNQGGTYPELDDVQVKFLRAALKRIQTDKFQGAVLIAVHHPPYVAVTAPHDASSAKHMGSREMLAEIDSACKDAGVWPHAVLSGHAHNYQRFTRVLDGRETPFLVSGNGGHAVAHLTKKGDPAIRVPQQQTALSGHGDKVVFESYDDQDFGYMRILVNSEQLRIEYHPASDGEISKTPDDSVTVDLKSHKIVRYKPLSAHA